MNYGRVTPRARSGTSGISTDNDISQGSGTWISPPDRVAAVTVAVHIPKGEHATFTIETSCSSIDTIGENGTGGYWDNPFGDSAVLHEDTVLMLANAITAIRVNCIQADSIINVCFVG